MMETIAARAAPEMLPADGRAPRIEKKRITSRLRTLEKQRLDYEDRWKSIRDYQLPFLGLFKDTGDETNKGRRKDLAIANGCAWLANQAFAAGIMSGLTPPSRQWFKLGFSNSSDEDVEAAQILDERQEIVEYVLHRSNFYNSAHSVYMELPFGQAPLGIFESPRTWVRFQPYTIGTYYLDVDSAGRVNTFCRRFQMNAVQIQEQFGNDLPRMIQDALASEGQRYDKTFDIYWMVCPNKQRPGGMGNQNMPWLSLYWVDGQSSDDHGGFLYVGGFEEFPVPTARYQVTGMEPYGKGPGWYAEGEAKSLQLMKRDFLTAAEMMIKPPMKAPANLRINYTPGGVTSVNEFEGQNTVGPLFQVPTNPSWLAQEIVRSEDTIKRIYSADLFLMLDSIDTPQMTAREVMERQQEKLQQLGPVVERLQDEFLSPIIERVYNILERRGAFPPIDPDLAERLQDKEVKIEYISPLAQAQKMSGLVNIEQATAFVAQMAQLYPEALKAIDPIQTVKRYFELLGAPAVMQRSVEDIQKMLQAEQEMAQEQQQMAQMQAMAQAAAPAAQAAKNITEAANDGNPALQNLMGVTGPGGPAV